MSRTRTIQLTPKQSAQLARIVSRVLLDMADGDLAVTRAIFRKVADDDEIWSGLAQRFNVALNTANDKLQEQSNATPEAKAM